MDLEKAREQIDRIDKEMAALFVRRMKIAEEISAYKLARGLPVEDRAREAAILAARSSEIREEDLRGFYIRFLQNTLELSKQWQQQLKMNRAQ